MLINFTSLVFGMKLEHPYKNPQRHHANAAKGGLIRLKMEVKKNKEMRIKTTKLKLENQNKLAF